MTLPNKTLYVAQRASTPAQVCFDEALANLEVSPEEIPTTFTEELVLDEWMIMTMLRMLRVESKYWQSLIEELDFEIQHIVTDVEAEFSKIVENDDDNGRDDSETRVLISHIKRQREELSVSNEKKVKRTATVCEKRLSKEAVSSMRSWLLDNVDYPYPTELQKQKFADESGLTLSQVRLFIPHGFRPLIKSKVNTWFTNARRRILKPIKRSNVPIESFKELLRS